jgi:hypothetical protein
MTTPQPTYNTLEQIQQRKSELRAGIQQQSDQIGTLWRRITAPQETTSKGELIASLVSNSVTAIDGFLLVRKLMKTYGWIFKRRKKK